MMMNEGENRSFWGIPTRTTCATLRNTNVMESPPLLTDDLKNSQANILTFKTLHMNTRKLYVFPERAFIYGFHIILTLNSDYFL